MGLCIIGGWKCLKQCQCFELYFLVVSCWSICIWESSYTVVHPSDKSTVVTAHQQFIPKHCTSHRLCSCYSNRTGPCIAACWGLAGKWSQGSNWNHWGRERGNLYPILSFREFVWYVTSCFDPFSCSFSSLISTVFHSYTCICLYIPGGPFFSCIHMCAMKKKRNEENLEKGVKQVDENKGKEKQFLVMNRTKFM